MSTSKDLDELIGQARQAVDRPTLTALVSQDAREKPFILESLAVGVAVYLLQRYAGAYLKGLGLDELAERVGRDTRAFLKRLRSGTPSEPDLEADKKRLAEALDAIADAGSDSEAASAAKKALVDDLSEAGVPDARAAAVAEAISDVVTRSRHG